MELSPPSGRAAAAPPNDDMVRAKKALRRSMRRLRRQVAPADALRAGTAAADHLLRAPECRALGADGALVAVYAALPEELPTAPLIERLRTRGAVLVYPRVTPGQKRLTFHRVAGAAELRPGVLSIPEPPADAPVVPVERIGLFVVPGLAFDPAGNRLGFGAGHYDITLADNPHALRVGMAYEFQVVDAVPAGPGDVRMGLVVTDAGVRRCAR
jgi:5-formyltetrahydrofolate cyclo-ligase